VTGLRLLDDSGHTLRIGPGERELAGYVYRPPEPQLESPRPYWHPVRTLGGELVSRYRPDDHVWHKGIAWSLPNVRAPAGTANFWGGTTYLRGRGYVQLPNNGTMVHREFLTRTATAGRATVVERLEWLTQSGRTWFDEHRTFTVSLVPAGWVLAFRTHFTNRTGDLIRIGSPTTEGRDNAGYGGLFWRGPESFTGGTVHTPQTTGGDELMGVRAPWLGFTGRPDRGRPAATLVFVDAPDNPGHPTRWFVRSHPYPCAGPAPFFHTETPVPPAGTVTLRYAVVVADGGPGPDRAGELAAAGRTVLARELRS
jgi:hypothetical protein